MKIIDSSLDIHKRIIPKAWGEEIIIHNGEDYCGKILRFKKRGRFSMHFHLKKSETWYVSKGSFKINWINTKTATPHGQLIYVGDIIEIPQGQPHQLTALEEAEIFEVSTQHFNDDSYRIQKGDNQC